jgi:competence protein ComEA
MHERVDRAQVTIWVAALLLLGFAAFRWFGGGGDDGGAPPVRIENGGNEGEARPGRVFVHVAGAVRRAGLYRLPAGARVGVAVRRAGGVSRRADLTRINLAAKVTDGQQVIVPVRGEAGAAPASGAGAGSAAASGEAHAVAGTPAGGQISLATATLEQLDSLDGIGPTLARRILEHRDRSGGFKSIEQLREIEGIGEKRFEALRSALAP